MRLHIEQGERIRQVAVAPGASPGQLLIELDGQQVACEVQELGQGGLSLRLPDGSMHDIVVESQATPATWVVYLSGLRMPVSVSNGTGKRKAAGGVSAHGPLRIVAPMPGKVVRVPVVAGDLVDARQPVVIIEAMKMENALAAGRAGTVREVLVQEGQSVEAGRALVVVE